MDDSLTHLLTLVSFQTHKTLVIFETQIKIVPPLKLQVTETYKIQKGYKGIVKVIYMNPAVLWIDMITLYDEQI